MTGHPTPAEYWENRYTESGKIWSGKPNAALVREISDVAPGTALDLGSGEGGDALWLAHRGWKVTAVDIAPSALAVGESAQQPGDYITWIAADLSTWQPPTSYDLVSACFLHSNVELPREEILRRAARAVAPGGLLLIVGHTGEPHWAGHDGGESHEVLPSPDDVFESLFADPTLNRSDWTVITNAIVARQMSPVHGEGTMEDGILTLRRH